MDTEREWFIVANSFAAPFVSDTSHSFVSAPTPQEALVRHAREYTHPASLYAAEVYPDATAFHKGFPPAARWLSNHAAALERTPGTSYFGHAPGVFKLDHRLVTVERPKEGAVYAGRKET